MALFDHCKPLAMDLSTIAVGAGVMAGEKEGELMDLRDTVGDNKRENVCSLVGHLKGVGALWEGIAFAKVGLANMIQIACSSFLYHGKSNEQFYFQIDSNLCLDIGIQHARKLYHEPWSNIISARII